MIWVTRWLCQHGHCAFSILWEDGQGMTQESAEIEGERGRQEAGLNPWCGICRGAIAPVHELTAYASAEEAAVALAEQQRPEFEARKTLAEVGMAEPFPAWFPRLWVRR